MWSARGKTCPNGWPTDRPAGRDSCPLLQVYTTLHRVLSDCSSFHVALGPLFSLVSGVIETNRLVLTYNALPSHGPNYTRYVSERLLSRESTCASHLFLVTFSPLLDSAMTAWHVNSSVYSDDITCLLTSHGSHNSVERENSVNIRLQINHP